MPEIEAPPDLWDESGEMLWIRADLAATPERAKRIAFAGHDPKRTVVLPETFLGGERWGYSHLDVKPEPQSLQPKSEGWNYPDATWWKCDPEEPDAVLYWQVTCK